MNFTLMKVFDSQDMPNDIWKSLLALWDEKLNVIQWRVADSMYEDDDPSKLIDAWLLANGAIELETVLIKCD